MGTRDYDLAAIGAGAGGLIASRFAARLGARVALVERDRIGGDCTWTGCVPSKSLIRAAKAAHEIRTAQRFGIAADACNVRMPDVRAYIQGKVNQIYEPTTPEALRREGIDVVIGPAAFMDAHTLRAGDQIVRAHHFLIATGARPAVPTIEGLTDVPYFTYQNIFENDRLPESLLVIGAGPLGLEIAQAYQRLGARVTIVGPRLLPRDDPQAADIIRRVFEREGVRLVFGRATSVRRSAKALVVSSEQEEASGEYLLVAVGRKPNVRGLELERAGVHYSERGVPVDDRLRTNVRHIYAAGDVIGGEQFSHIAGWQAFQAARNALLPGNASGRPNPMAWVTFTDPEVAQVGLTEQRARERLGDWVHSVTWENRRVDRAVCDDDEDGFIKIVADAKGAIVGATIVASRAGEVSAEMSVAIAHRLTIRDLAGAVHAYPTYATAAEQMASELATSRWLSGVQGRIVTRLMGFTPAARSAHERTHAEARR